MKLQTKIILVASLIVISLGIITIGAIHTLVARIMLNEMTEHGIMLTEISGSAIANSLIEDDRVAVQEFLHYLKDTNPNITYAYAVGNADRVIIHTFASGFPQDLLTANRIPHGQLTQMRQFNTEIGSVQDFGWRLTDKLDMEMHVGFSQTGIIQTLNELTWIIVGLTGIGMGAGVIASIAFGRFVTLPLKRLTMGVERFGSGNLAEPIPVSSYDELGDLTRAFNSMAAELGKTIAELRVSQAGYRALIEASGRVGEAIALIRDENVDRGTFLFANDEFCRLTGYDRIRLLNLNAAEVIHPYSVSTVYDAWQAIRDGQTAALSYEMTLLTRAGHNVIAETSGTIVNYEGQRALAWFIRDITERKMREAEIQQQNRELTALNAVSAIMNQHSGNIEQMLQQALEQVLTTLGVPAGWISIAPEDSRPYIAAVAGLSGSIAELETHFPDCDCGRVLDKTRLPTTVKPEGKCPSFNLHTHEGTSVKQHASVPLIAGGHVVGALSVAAPSSSYFNSDNFRLMVIIGTQLGVALENVRLWKDLQNKERLRAQLLAKAIRAQEDERRRIARELHDELGQSLNALIFGLKTAEITVEQNVADVQDVLRRLRVATSDAVRELQTVIYDLRPSLLDDLGLIPALRWYAESRIESQGIRVSFETGNEDEARFSPDVETALFRIAQEALTNVLKYAEADTIQIRLTSDKKKITLVITDNGKGFDLSSVLKNRGRDGRGLGLLGMRERAELLAGTCHVESELGVGTHIQVEIPYVHDTLIVK
jgi:PAS domain S-box-containing protein